MISVTGSAKVCSQSSVQAEIVGGENALQIHWTLFSSYQEVVLDLSDTSLLLASDQFVEAGNYTI